ncbi:hypothetical protein C475_06450 [Halosimplex carlsbadense 2-9-1]|uniref:Gylcosyl hydrolase 115 C-terminal domain-containing protein n=1 Tax=Halosimplex carlsbadense 2-9-1 TaxID=797114 RepID=M0CY58_9EURY|nr:hypothetical protein [Halosimplex carlsbadense]ELZ27538.1 hypothetical protein C475_06450 [Halosimplex carlsbadense 2-9-1]
MTADSCGERADAAHERIVEETRYFNETLLDGKWDQMMSYHPRDLPVFDELRTATVEGGDVPGLGVIPEGHHEPVQEGAIHPPSLPTFDRRTDRDRFLGLFARGTEPVEWTVETSDDWIELSEEGGTLADETRLRVGVDWAAVPDGGATGTVTILRHKSPWGCGNEKKVRVVATPARQTGGDFAVVDGVAAMEAEHASRRREGEGTHWVDADVPGQVSGETVAVVPAVFESYDPDTGDAPRLEFDVDVPDSGTVTVDVYCIPTQSLTEERDLRYAVDIGDDRVVTSIDPAGGEHNHTWQQNVLRGAAVGTTRHEIPAAGVQTFALDALDPSLVVDRIVVLADSDEETYLGPRETSVDD